MSGGLLAAVDFTDQVPPSTNRRKRLRVGFHSGATRPLSHHLVRSHTREPPISIRIWGPFTQAGPRDGNHAEPVVTRVAKYVWQRAAERTGVSDWSGRCRHRRWGQSYSTPWVSSRRRSGVYDEVPLRNRRGTHAFNLRSARRPDVGPISALPRDQQTPARAICGHLSVAKCKCRPLASRKCVIIGSLRQGGCSSCPPTCTSAGSAASSPASLAVGRAGSRSALFTVRSGFRLP